MEKRLGLRAEQHGLRRPQTRRPRRRWPPGNHCRGTLHEERGGLFFSAVAADVRRLTFPPSFAPRPKNKVSLLTSAATVLSSCRTIRRTYHPSGIQTLTPASTAPSISRGCHANSIGAAPSFSGPCLSLSVGKAG